MLTGTRVWAEPPGRDDDCRPAKLNILNEMVQLSYSGRRPRIDAARGFILLCAYTGKEVV
jgi:hypothetical protein